MFFISYSSDSTLNDFITKFYKQFPVRQIEWNNIESVEIQEELINLTVGSDLVISYPINITYQKQFLKSVLNHLTEKKSEVACEIYEAVGRLVALPTSLFSYNYHFVKTSENSAQSCVILKENTNIISEGTTGLKTWQASKALSNWILHHSEYFKGKAIVELGSGLGLTGIVSLLFSQPKKYIFTDCHPTVLSILNENVHLNIDDKVNSECLIKELSWEETTVELCGKFGKIDFIFGADIVYDNDLFDSLLNTLECFALNGTRNAVFACTERNPETLKSFWDACKDREMTVKFLEEEVPHYLSWQDPDKTKVILAQVNF